MLRVAHYLFAIVLVSVLTSFYSDVGRANEKDSEASIARVRLAADHSLDRTNHLIATDLSHGVGAASQSVVRTWYGSKTLNSHFGSGWSDLNLVRLNQTSNDSLVVWRGGIGWLSANRKDGNWIADGGMKIQREGENWILENARSQKLKFDVKGRLVSIKSSTGTARLYEYDERDRLILIQHHDENKLVYRYSDDDRVQSVEGPEGLLVEYQYDEKGRLSSVKNSRSVSIQYEYNKVGELVRVKDSFGIHFDAPKTNETGEAAKKLTESNSAKLKLASTSKLKSLVGVLPNRTITFDRHGRTQEEVESGQKLQYRYDNEGRVESIEGPAGKTSFEYDIFGRVTKVTQPGGLITDLTFNKLDLPLEIGLPDRRRFRCEFNPFGLLSRCGWSTQNWQQFQYDEAGLIASMRRAPEFETKYDHDSQERIEKVHFSLGNDVQFAFDKADHVTRESWSTGQTRKWSYSPNGKLSQFENAHGLITKVEFGEDGQTGARSDPLHGKTRFTRDETSSEYSIESEGLGKWLYRFNPHGMIASITSAGKQVRRFNYNDSDMLVSSSTPSGATWSYEYDEANRLKRIQSPSASETQFTHNEAGQIESIHRGDLAWQSYHYDKHGRIDRINSPSGIASSYVYSSDGKMTEIRTPDGNSIVKENETGTGLQIKGNDYDLNLSFHPDGSLASKLCSPSGLELRFPIDKFGRASGIELNEIRVAYQYDAKGRLTTIALPNSSKIQISKDEAGRPTQLSFGSTSLMKLAYDRADRITTIESVTNVGDNKAKTSFSEKYQYDDNGNLKNIATGASEQTALAYDDDNRLTRLTQGQRETQFSFDADGNLWSSGLSKNSGHWELDKLGRPTARGQMGYAWDESGNLARTETLNSKTENTFDAAGRMVRRRVDKKEWRYGYLPNGDRLWQEGPTGKQWYAYLNEGLAAYKDERGIQWLIVYYPGTDWPLALCGSNGETLFATADQLHSLRRLVDAKGTLVASAGYGPYGSLESVEGTKRLNLFAGMLRDDSGVYYARRRYYDAHLMRFISIDPLVGGYLHPESHNMYSYAANNPYRYRDPRGTDAFEAFVKGADEYGVAPGWTKYNYLKPTEATATRTAWENAERMKSVMSNPSSTLEEVRAAGESLKYNLSEIERLKEIGRIRYVNQAYTEALNNGGFYREQKFAGPTSGGAGGPPGASGTNPARGVTSPNAPVASEAAEGAAKAVKPEVVKNVFEHLTPEGEALTRKLHAEAEERLAQLGAEGYAGRGTSGMASGTFEQAGRVASSPIVEAAVEGIGLRVLKFLGRLLPWGQAAVDIDLAYRVNREEWGMIQADYENLSAQDRALAIRRMLENKITEALRDPAQSNRVIPRDFDGKPPDPTKETDMVFIFNQIHTNLDKGLKPFDGILTDAGDKVPAEGQKGLQTALQSGRGLVNQGTSLESSIWRADADANGLDDVAKNKIREAVEKSVALKPMYEQLGELPAAVDLLRQQIAKVQSDTTNLGKAAEEMFAASEMAQANATLICDYASRSAKSTPAQSDAWKKEAAALIRKSAMALQAAQQKIDGLNFSADKLIASINKVESFRNAIENLGLISSSAITNSLNAAEESINKAKDSRDAVSNLSNQLKEVKTKATGVLSSYTWDNDANQLLSQAKSLGTNLPPPTLISSETLLTAAKAATSFALSNATNLEQTIANLNIGELKSSAEAAMSEFELEKTAIAFASAPGAYRPLQQALNCYSQIKGSDPNSDNLGADLKSVLGGMYMVTTGPTPDSNDNSTGAGSTGSKNSVASNSGSSTPKNPPPTAPPPKGTTDDKGNDWNGRWAGTINYITTSSLVSIPPINQPAILNITQSSDTVRISSMVGGMEEVYPLKIDPKNPKTASFTKEETGSAEGASTKMTTTVSATLQNGTIDLNVTQHSFTVTEFGTASSDTKGKGAFKRGK